MSDTHSLPCASISALFRAVCRQTVAMSIQLHHLPNIFKASHRFFCVCLVGVRRCFCGAVFIFRDSEDLDMF